jgi:hypothetical protein
MKQSPWYKRFSKPLSVVLFTLMVGTGAGAGLAPFITPAVIEAGINEISD